MNLQRVTTIYQKDIRDALRDSRLIVAILLPLLLGLLYSFMFQDETKPTARIGVVSASASRLPAELEAATRSAVTLKVQQVADQAALEKQVRDETVDIGLVIPSGFDAALKAGRTPELTVVLSSSPSFGGDYVAASLDRATRTLAGVTPVATITPVIVAAPKGSAETAFSVLGARTVFILVAIVIMLAMIAVYALPAVLTEETEKRTLEALTLIASDWEVIAAKALFGLTYCVISVPLMLLVTRVRPTDVTLFVLDMVLTAVTLVGLGLLVGVLLRTQTQLNTWSTIVLLPLIAPTIVVGIPLPAWAETAVSLLPTAATMRLGANAFAGRPLYSNEWLSVAIILAWGVVAYGLVWWRLAQRQRE